MPLLIISCTTILLIGAQCHLPKPLLLRMGLNIALNTMIGAIPVFGDVFSIWFKSNVRNAQLLERYVRTERRPSAFTDWVFVAGLIVGLLLFFVATLVAIAWLVKQLWNMV
jgi:hypothetical protein